MKHHLRPVLSFWLATYYSAEERQLSRLALRPRSDACSVVILVASKSAIAVAVAGLLRTGPSLH